MLDDPVLLADTYAAASIASIAEQIGVSTTTVQRALVRHGIDRLPRTRNTRPPTAQRLDDTAWLAEQYRTRTGVDIADELGVTARTVYAAIQRHGIARRPASRTLALRQPELADPDWLHAAADRTSSRQTAAELRVSAGAVTDAYRRAGIDPSVTTRLYAKDTRDHDQPPTLFGRCGNSKGPFEVSAGTSAVRPRPQRCGSPKPASSPTPHQR